jgi:tol-pal system protein YbgF
MPGHAPGIDVFCGRKQGVRGRASVFSHNFDAARRMLPISTAAGLAIMTRSRHRIRTAALAALTVLLMASGAVAQEGRSSGGFLDNLFSRGEPPAQQAPADQRPADQPPGAQGDPSSPAVRLDRIENALRQLTGTVEQLQYRNQQLEMQLKRMQDDTEYRFQQLGSKGRIPAGAAPRAMSPPGPPNTLAAAGPGQRSDVFDPAQHPNAPGVPRVLGNESAVAVPQQNTDNVPPVGIPGGRAAGAPLDLSTLHGDAPVQPNVPVANAGPMTSLQLPPPARNSGAPRTQLATLPPSATPRDEYDMAYGYVLHKDYALAEQAFSDFLRKYPDEKLVPEARYWLGESLFQRQRYRDAAESFLAVSTKYEHSGKAPEALLRLGQSLAALNQKEAACATLAEVERKFPRAPASVKRGVAQELKRTHC